MNLLDAAWAAVNALGGTPRKGDLFDEGYVEAIDKALAEIERLGGMDPLDRISIGTSMSESETFAEHMYAKNPKMFD